MNILAIRTAVFRENDDLEEFVARHIPKLKEGSILVVTSKIVALSQSRTVPDGDETHRESIIRAESQFAIRTKYTWLTVKDGMVMSSAGIDKSNADGKIILLPTDSFAVASALRAALQNRYSLQNVGVLITDSRMLPFRAGSVGVAIGYAGFRGVRDYRGAIDIFGRTMKYSRSDVADSLAAAAVLDMGEGSEQQPLAVIESPCVEWTDKIDSNELYVDPKDDIYRPLFDVL